MKHTVALTLSEAWKLALLHEAWGLEFIVWRTGIFEAAPSLLFLLDTETTPIVDAYFQGYVGSRP